MTIENFLIPTLASSLLLGFYDICKKRAVLDNPVAPTLFFSNLCGSIFFVAVLFFSGRIYAALAHFLAAKHLTLGIQAQQKHRFVASSVKPGH